MKIKEQILMFTHSGGFEANNTHYDVVAATSFVDVDPIANPTPFIAKQPELFRNDWEGPTEVVALIVDEHQIAAAGVLRYCTPDPNTLEVYAIGQVGEDIEDDVLKATMRERVEQRRAAMSSDKKPVHTVVHWGAEPPTLPVVPAGPAVGLAGFNQTRAQRHRERVERFMEELKRPG